MVDSMSDVVDGKILLLCFQHPESTATDEERALRLLSRHPHPERVREIWDRDYCSDHYESSLLHYACQNGWYDVSRDLVDKYQCDPHLKNWRGDTPLHWACKGGSMDIVRFLTVDHHCDPACRERVWGRTPLHRACESGKLDIVKFLVEECHCDPRVKDKYGDTPSHFACVGGGIDIVRFLVEECHYDPFRAKDKFGGTPLHLAAQEDLNVLLFLLSRIPPLQLVNSVLNYEPLLSEHELYSPLLAIPF